MGHIGDWGSKIKVDASANEHSLVSVKLSLAETQIGTFQYATVSMSIVFPIGSGMSTFTETFKEFERRIGLQPVSREEFKMIQTINVDWQDTRAAIILIFIMLVYAFVFYVNAKKNR